MGTELWHPEIQVTEELVKNCLSTQFPALMPLQELKCIGQGWDNKVFLINKNFIFRFPHREIAAELIDRENVILKALQIIKNIEIPDPIYLGRPSTEFPYPFHGYKMILGKSGCHANLTERDRLASLPVLTEFLKQLHRINASTALQLGAKPQVFDRTNVAKAINWVTERVVKIITGNICKINMAEFQSEMIKAADINLPKDNQCLIHGDLYCRHLMFNQGRLTGIIDWGDVGINNRSVDLAVIWSFFPQSCHQQFMDLYGPVDNATWQYARFLGIYSALTLILYASDISDTLLLSEAINSAKRINSKLIVD